jgi:hypothetical protein
MIFYRENCADMGLTEADIDESFIAEARAVLATGTHLSHPRTGAAVLMALTLARAHGTRTALDIDYRPNLWGVAGHGEGESRFVESEAVTRKLQATLHHFDLRHRGGTPHRRRRHRHHHGAPGGALGLGRHAGLQTWREGGGRLRGRCPASLDGSAAPPSGRARDPLGWNLSLAATTAA